MLSGFTFLLHGIDTLQCAYYLRCEPDSVLDFTALLAQREALRVSCSRDPAVVSLGSAEFLLQPYGSGSGYPLVLTNPDFKIECGEFNRPSFFVTFRSEALWRDSAARLQARFLEWASSVGFVLERPESVSRVDWAFDYHLPVRDFDESHFVSVAARTPSIARTGAFRRLRSVARTLCSRLRQGRRDQPAEPQGVVLRALGRRMRGRVADRVAGSQGAVTQLSAFARWTTCLSARATCLAISTSEHTTLRVPTDDSNRSRWPLHPLWLDLHQRIAEFDALGASARTSSTAHCRSD